MTTGGVYQFKSPSRQETPRRLVIIGNVDVQRLQASAVDFNGGGILLIDLTAYNAPVIQYPKSGEHWYVELIQQRWVLGKKDIIGSPAFLNKSVSPGDQLWDSQGNVVKTVSGSVIETIGGGLSQTVTGNVAQTVSGSANRVIQGSVTDTIQGTWSITDSNGSLTTFPAPSWQTVTINPTYLAKRLSTYPQAMQVIKLNNNSVYIRGLVNITGLASLTTCAQLPSGFYPPYEADFSVRSDQPNVSILITPTGALQFDYAGTSPTWSFVNGSWCALP